MTDTKELDGVIKALLENLAYDAVENGLRVYKGKDDEYEATRNTESDIETCTQAILSYISKHYIPKNKVTEAFKCEFGHEVYGHKTADGFCCACDYDVACIQTDYIPKSEADAAYRKGELEGREQLASDLTDYFSADEGQVTYAMLREVIRQFVEALKDTKPKEGI